MATGTFDPAAFMDAAVTGANSTEYIPVPEGDYIAVITDKMEVRQWQGKKDQTKTGIALDLQWSIDDQAVKTLLERDQVNVKHGIMLDTDANGGISIAKGHNVQLGKLREAVGLNDPSKPFGFRMLTGKVARINVKHRVGEDGQIFAEVAAVARL